MQIVHECAIFQEKSRSMPPNIIRDSRYQLSIRKRRDIVKNHGFQLLTFLHRPLSVIGNVLFHCMCIRDNSMIRGRRWLQFPIMQLHTQFRHNESCMSKLTNQNRRHAKGIFHFRPFEQRVVKALVDAGKCTAVSPRVVLHVVLYL